MFYLKLIFILTFYAITFTAQNKKIASLIKGIDDSEFVIIHNKQPTFATHSKNALKLIKVGLPASEKLIETLSDSSKVIMAHLILCHIYFNVATFAGPKKTIVNEVDVSHYFLGQKDGEGLVISEVTNNGAFKIYVEPKAIEKIISYWKKKIAKK